MTFLGRPRIQSVNTFLFARKIASIATDVEHPLIKQALALHEDKRQRHRQGCITTSSLKLLPAALSKGWRLKSFLYSSLYDTAGLPSRVRKEVFKRPRLCVDHDLMNKFASRHEAPMLLAVLETPTRNKAKSNDRFGKLGSLDELTGATTFDQGVSVVLEGLRDVGNLGTILRSSAAFGAPAVFMLPGCADAWDSRCLASGAGAQLAQPMASLSSITDAIDVVSGAGHPMVDVFVAVAHPDELEDARISALPRIEKRNGIPCVLFVGSETSGVSHKSIQELLVLRRDGKIRILGVHIPQSATVESLNVATAVSILLAPTFKS